LDDVVRELQKAGQGEAHARARRPSSSSGRDFLSYGIGLLRYGLGSLLSGVGRAGRPPGARGRESAGSLRARGRRCAGSFPIWSSPARSHAWWAAATPCTSSG
jgi:hypothetical protein